MSPVIAGYDIETTGLLASDQRIIEVYLGLWRDGKRIFAYEQRIDPQRSIAADAQRVHGISYSDLVGMPLWDAVAPKIVTILSKADIVVGHNARDFDMKFTEMELQRLGLKMPEAPLIDTMLDGVWATADGKRPRLSELCFACEVEYDPAKAHAASYDVEVMMECFHRAVSWGYIALPELPRPDLAVAA